MTAMLTALTALGVLLIGIGSYLQFDDRRGYSWVAKASEAVGVATIVLGHLIVELTGPEDCYALGADCPTTLLGFAWRVLGGGVLLWSALAFIVGWAVAKLTPGRGDQDHAGLRNFTGPGGTYVPPNPPPPIVLTPPPPPRAAAPPRPSPAQVRTWPRITVHDQMAHLLGPDGRSACGRALPGHRPAEPQTPLCQLCARRSAAPAP